MSDYIEEAIENLNKWAVKIVSEPELATEFVKWSVCFDGNFNMSNQILIFLQCRKASIIRTEEEWKKLGHKPKSPDIKPIKTIFKDEKGYYTMDFFDISMVDVDESTRVRYYFDIQDKVDALLLSKPLEHVRKMNMGDTTTHIMYDMNKGVFYYKPGIKDKESFFMELAREYAHFSLKCLLDHPERLRFLGISDSIIETLKYSRGPFAFPASGAGYIIADIYEVTEFSFSSTLFTGKNVGCEAARCSLCLYTEPGRCVRRMYESGITRLLEHKARVRKNNGYMI